MTINTSRIFSAKTCWLKTLRLYHQRKIGTRAIALVNGAAFHKGVAVGQASGDWEAAKAEAKALFDEDFPKAGFLPEQAFLYDSHLNMVHMMMDYYRDNPLKDSVIIQPECRFSVDVPGSEHNDITIHWQHRITWKDHWGPPQWEDIRDGNVVSPHSDFADQRCKCWQPHRFVGKVDGIVLWNGHWWIQEHKTTSIKDDRFWRRWHLDPQPTGYIWAIGRTLGTYPKGVIVNAIYKPSEGQVQAWNNKRKYGGAKGVEDYMGFERQAFLRSAKMLENFPAQIKMWADQWERNILHNTWPQSTMEGHCHAYNRECDYYQLCLNEGDQSFEDALYDVPELDYVEEEHIERLYQIGA